MSLELRVRWLREWVVGGGAGGGAGSDLWPKRGMMLCSQSDMEVWLVVGAKQWA